jgi:hypothetical protein
LAKRSTKTRHASGFALVSCLTARWTLSSAASGQDVPGQERDGDDRRRDSDDGDGGGGYDHTAILASLFRVETAADYGKGLTTSSFLAAMAAKTSCFSRSGTLSGRARGRSPGRPRRTLRKRCVAACGPRPAPCRCIGVPDAELIRRRAAGEPLRQLAVGRQTAAEPRAVSQEQKRSRDHARAKRTASRHP